MSSSDGVLLYGGGIDSTTLLAFLRSKGYDPHLLFFDYNQKANRLEEATMLKWATPGKHKTVKLDLSQLVTSNIMDGESLADTPSSNVLEGRNLIFLSLAAAWASTLNAPHVYLGFHAEPEGAPFPDATPEFFNSANQVLAKGFVHNVQLKAPFQTWTRTQIFKWAKDNAPEALNAHTCYEDVAGGCGKCSHCVLKEKILSELSSNPGSHEACAE